MANLSPEAFSTIIHHYLDSTHPDVYYQCRARLLLVNRQWRNLIDEDAYCWRVLNSRHADAPMRRAVEKSGDKRILLVYFRRDEIRTWFVDLVLPLFDRWAEIRLDWPLQMNFPSCYADDNVDELRASAKLGRALLAHRKAARRILTYWGLASPGDLSDTPDSEGDENEEEQEEEQEEEEEEDAAENPDDEAEAQGSDTAQGTAEHGDGVVDIYGGEEEEDVTVHPIDVPPNWHYDLLGESLREARLTDVHSDLESVPWFSQSIFHRIFTCPNLETLSLNVNESFSFLPVAPIEPFEPEERYQLSSLKSLTMHANVAGITHFLSTYHPSAQAECTFHVNSLFSKSIQQAGLEWFKQVIGPVLSGAIQATAEPVLVLDVGFVNTVYLTRLPSKFTITAQGDVGRVIVNTIITLPVISDSQTPIQIRLFGSSETNWPKTLWPDGLASCPPSATSLVLACCMPQFVLDKLKELLAPDAVLPALAKLSIQDTEWRSYAPASAAEELLGELSKMRPGLVYEMITSEATP